MQAHDPVRRYDPAVDLDALADAWRRRSIAARTQVEASAEHARAAANVAARVLVDEFGASEVWLFGSLVWGPLHAGSDVDLAVRGIPPGRHFSALTRACEIVGGSVDLVSLETCAESFGRRVRERGVRLHGG